MNLLIIISGSGLSLSFISHFLTFFGINPQNVIPGIWMLHIGIFVVWLPTVLIAKKNRGKYIWQESIKFAPKWMITISKFLFFYMFFNFFFTIFVLQSGGSPNEINGKKILSNHGNIIKELTDEEYNRHNAYTVRTLSGHWMIFYCVAMTVLYSYSKEKRLDKENSEE